LSQAFDVNYFNVSYFEVLILTRNFIHKGHKLLTHPLSGSVKPNETPYKSIVISAQASALDLQSVSIIEESIACYKKFDEKKIPRDGLNDFMEIDCGLIESNLSN
jgi:hypothetical protein